MADRYGKRKMIIRAGLSLVLVYALLSVVQTPWQLIIVRLLHGLAGGFIPASMSIVASISPEKKLSSNLGIMIAGTMSGGVLGPLIGGSLASLFGLRLSFIVSSLLVLAAALAVVFWVKSGDERSVETRSRIRDDLATVFKNHPLTRMLLLLLLFQLSASMIQPLLALHIAALQGSLERAALFTGFVFALIGVAGIIASPFWGREGQRRGYTKILAFCLIAGGIRACVQYFVDQLWLFTVVQFIFGLCIAGIAPSVNTLIVQSTDDKVRGRSFGIIASANQLVI